MSFPPRLLDDIRARLTLSETIGGRVKLSRAGREYKGLCPFHREKSPSFYVNDDKQFFHCFGCGAHGDVIGFTMRHENLSFPDAVRDLAARAGLAVPETSRTEIEQATAQKTYLAAMEVATQWFTAQLYAPKNQEALGYLTGRGLSTATIDNFRLGYAPDDERALIAHLTAAGVTPTVQAELGLIKTRERDGSAYAFFRDRIIFPVMDRAGRVIAFGGRVMPEHMRPPTRGDFKPPKYLNSPETPLFHKGQTVYAIAHARAAAAEGKPIIVVEGYVDVIACHQAGIKGAVAPLGTALTDEQIQLLWRMIPGGEKVIHLCFDGDEAGVRAAARAAEKALPLLKPDHSLRFTFLPKGEDPDTLIVKQGVEALHAVIDKALPLAEYLWQTRSVSRRLDDPEDRAGLEAQLDVLVGQIVDPKTKYHYQNFFRTKLRERFRSPGSGPAGMRQWTPGGKPVPLIRPTARPRGMNQRGVDVLLSVLMHHPQIYDQVDEKIGFLEIDDPERAALRHDLLDALPSWDGQGDFITLFLEKYAQHHDIIRYFQSDRVMVHAGFAKDHTDLAAVLAGWDEVYQNLQYAATANGRM